MSTGGSGGGPVSISDVTGLQAALDAKIASTALADYVQESDVSADLTGDTDSTIPRRSAGRIKATTAVDGDDVVNKSQLDSVVAEKADLSSGHIPVIQAPAASVFYVTYSGSSWPSRPTTRTDVSVFYMSLTSADPAPSDFVAGADYLFKPAT